MRWFIIKLAFGLGLLLAGVDGRAEGVDSARVARRTERFERRVVRFEQRRENYRSAWANALPKYQVAQFAGSIGAFSLGMGWDYGKGKRWETEFLFGYLPRFSSDEGKVTFTLRENYVPWQMRLKGRWSYKPLAVSLGLNTVLDDNFWVREPEKYPAPYYKFSTRIRFLLFFGQRFSVDLDEDMWFKRLEFFYALGTCDLYVISAFTNRCVRPRDILSFSVGVKFQVF